MIIRKHDFVEIEYTGRIMESGDVFDTTDEKVAKAAKIYQQSASYSPIIICIGEGHVLGGLDGFLEGKDLGEYKVDLPAERAFGRKNASLIRMVPAKRFREQKIEPVVGLRLSIDNHVGVVRSVNGGRTVVDFNHPLAGRDVSYDVKVNRVVTDRKECVSALLNALLGLQEIKVEIDGEKVKVELPVDLPEKILDELKKKARDLVKVELDFVKK